MFLPLQLKVENRLCVIVGGGRVAARKCRALLDHDASVRVVATALCANEIWDAPRVSIVHGKYQTGLLEGAFLVIAATDDGEINAQVERDAQSAGVLAMRVDCPEDSDFLFPASLRRGDFTLSFGTDGTAPTLATVLRNQAEECFGDNYAELCTRAAAARQTSDWKELGCSTRREAMRKLAQNIVPDYPWASDSARGNEPVRSEESREDFLPGHVYLVGAGPGDPGLITVKGVACLRAATVVVHDALANPVLLDLYCQRAQRVDVSKRKGMCQHMQPEINDMLVEYARRGEVVVRLKGGDPMIFGRAGEEARALTNAGVPFEIVPGISSLASVPAYAGIPVTDREFGAHSLGIYSLHLRNGKGLSDEQWLKMANGPDTLVLFMGMTVIQAAVDNLTRNGLPGVTPIALITQGTTDRQKQVFGTLDTIMEKLSGLQLEGPGLIVIGNVVKAAATMNWKHVVEAVASGELSVVG